MKGRNDPVWFIKEQMHIKFEPHHLAQEAIIRDFYRAIYNPTLLPYLKLALLAGQRSGKTALCSMMGLYELFRLYTLPQVPWEYYSLMRGQEVMINVLSTGKEQAEDSIWGNMCAMFEYTEFFERFTDLRKYAETIQSESANITARIISSSSSTGAGRTSAFVAIDEIDLFDDTAGKRGAWLIHDKMWNSCQTLNTNGFQDGHMALISSSNDNPGSIMNTVIADANRLTPEGLRSEPQTLALIKPTWEMNSAFTEAALFEANKNNLQAFYRDFACLPGMFSGMEFPNKVKLCPMPNVLELSANDDFVMSDPTRQHVLAIDPSATNDSFGMACAYKASNGRTIVDGVLKYTKKKGDPFINPEDIDRILETAYPKLNVYAFIHDTWMYPHLVKKAMNLGIQTEKHIVNKEDYDRWKSMEEDGVLDVVFDHTLAKEANELKVIKGTKVDRVDHPSKGSKDVADCVANCIWFLDGQEPPEPRRPPLPLVLRINRGG